MPVPDRFPLQPLLAGVLVLATGGCATTSIQAQWTDPEFTNQPLHGGTVLVRCDAEETALRRICADQLVQQLEAAGARAVPAADRSTAERGGSRADDATLEAARSVGAMAVLTASVVPDATVANYGPTFGIGVGSWGGDVSTGVGVSVPVGGTGVSTAYAADMVLTDVATGRVMWTSRISAPASRDAGAQMAKLAQVGVQAAKASGLF
jgi:hypothetical protein